MSLENIALGIEKAAKDFADKLHQQKLKKRGNQIEKEIKVMEQQIRDSRGDTETDHIQFTI